MAADDMHSQQGLQSFIACDSSLQYMSKISPGINTIISSNAHTCQLLNMPTIYPPQGSTSAPSLPYRAQANRPMITVCVNLCSPRSVCPALLTASTPPLNSHQIFITKLQMKGFSQVPVKLQMKKIANKKLQAVSVLSI